jgi:disulfide bond formation protein DsbB
MTFSEDRVRAILAWVVIILVVGPVGAAVWLGVLYGESPCILCWAQRTSMVLIALVGLFVLRYGPRPKYLGMAVLLGAWGTFMAIRHSGLHLARDIGQGFAAPYFGAHTYAWAWLVHWVVLLTIGALLFLLREAQADTEPRPLTRTGTVAVVLFVAVVAANAFQAFVTTGPPPFIGQADPVRFSLNPKRWVWMYEDEIAGRISLRGRWTVPKPDPAHLEGVTDPANGPLADLPVLTTTNRLSIRATLDGRLTDLAIDPATGRFLATTDHFSVYVLDSSLARIEHRVHLDHQYSIDLTPLAGAAFVGDTLTVLATNKSYVLLRPDPDADPDREWRHFKETTGGIAELRRSRFATVRARQQYVLSLAYERDSDEFITVSVPSPRHQRMVVSRFDRRDRMLASEFLPRLADSLTLNGPDRSLAEYVVTGATVADGLLYAVSAAYSTLLAIDLERKMVTGAWRLMDIEQPVGLAMRGSELLVAEADGEIVVFERPRGAHR